jgi:hypothetical protein
VDRGVIVGSGDLLDELQLSAGFGDINQGTDDVGLAYFVRSCPVCKNAREKKISSGESRTSCAAFNFMRT